MGKAGMGLKKCSTSTDVEHAKGKKKRKKSTASDVNTATEHSQKAKKERASKKMAAHDVNIDGHASTIEDVHDEIKKLRDSFKEMTETMKNLQDSLLAKADVPEKETSKEKVEPAGFECSFATKDPQLIHESTIFVKGFDTSLPRDDIKNALVEHFGSCGEMTRLLVPFESHSVASKGYAFIDLKKNHGKALQLDGSYLGGRKLEVMVATRRREFECFEECSYCCRKKSFGWIKKSLQPFRVKPPPGWGSP